jgi:tetratricopeptide (TPR) repeat protein
MARRVPLQPVAAALFAVVLAPAAAHAAPASGSVLASYSFDDTVATGPDTFAIWQGARHTATGQGRVSLSTSFHVSGYRSVEIKDVAGDGDFPELQGYFPARTAGRLFFHFAFLTTDPKEELNVALAGPRFFQMEKDGISFWLATRAGQLVHVSDSIPKKLFPVQPFVWYAVDVAYDLAAGTYALTIHGEGQDAPLVALRDQPNTIKQAGSAVDKFSFVGSPYGDRSNVVYYVDDVVIGTDSSVTPRPFVAPGRRKLFIDLFRDYQKLLLERPRCLPPSGPEDVGFTADDLTGLAREGLLDAAERLLAGQRLDRQAFVRRGEGRWRAVLEALADWSAGCEALESGDPARALPRFEAAAAAVPEGQIFSLSAALALAGLKRFAEADERLALLSDWRDDPRYAVVSAFVGIARGDLDRAEAWLRDPASRVLDRDANPLLRVFREGFRADVLQALKVQLGAEFQDRLEETLVTEQYYYVQLWKGRHDVARDYALRMAERLRRAELPAGIWVGRAGDASFYGQDLRDARELYEQAIRGEKDNGALMALYLKLADLAYLSGDLETERRLREHYYGVLTE